MDKEGIFDEKLATLVRLQSHGLRTKLLEDPERGSMNPPNFSRNLKMYTFATTLRYHQTTRYLSVL